MNKTTDPSPSSQLTGLPVVFQMTGQDGLAFLQNQTLTDLSKHPKQMVYTGICNPKGRLLFSLFVLATDEVIKLAVDASLSDNFFQYVNMRRFRMDFELKKTDQILDFNQQVAQPVVSQDSQFADAHETVPEAADFWRFMFQLGLPWITADTAEAFIPQHVNLEQESIIDFDKGCYPGQEIIARLHFLGKVKNKCV